MLYCNCTNNNSTSNTNRRLGFILRMKSYWGIIMNRMLEHSMKSYIKIFLIGILVGCVCRLADYFPAETLWSFSSIQTLLGFWMITNTIIVLRSTSNICAGISSFLYMFGMSLSYYGLKAILGIFIPMFSDSFNSSLFVMYSVLAIPCGIAAFVLYYWNKDNIFNSVLYSLPVGGLAAETVATAIYLSKFHSFLFQLLMDAIGMLAFGIIFSTRVKSKKIYGISIILSALLCYFVIYHQAVST